MNRLEWIAKRGSLPFDLDFLRAAGFRFALDWDDEVSIEAPTSLDLAKLEELIARFTTGIRTRLQMERRQSLQVCVGGPMNGTRLRPEQTYVYSSGPILFHVKRGEWAVYRIRDRDPRAWFVGTATSKPKARQLWAKSL